MLKRTLALVAVPVTALTLAACGSSSSAGSSGSTPSDGMSMSKDSGMSGMKHNQADITFASQMIPHHQQAVDMAGLVASRSSNSQVRSLAAKISAAQAPEIATMTSWLKAWNQPTPEAMNGMDMPGMMTMAQMKKLAGASGQTFDRLFLTMMVAHHTSAIAMAQQEQSGGQDAMAKELAGKIVKDQTAEIAEIKTILASL